MNMIVQGTPEWRAARRNSITGTEVAALFGLDANLTRFELWHRKKGAVEEPDFSDNERVFWGQVLEPAIARGVAETQGWTLRQVNRYLTHPTVPRFAGSPDYEIVANTKGPGVVDIKTVDWMIFKDWENAEPPPKYLLQLQSYLDITGRSWGALGVLVGGNDLRVFEYERRPPIIAAIHREIAAFWASIEANEPPPADFLADADTIRKLHVENDGKTADMADNVRLAELCRAYKKAAAEAKAGDDAKTAALAEILTIVGSYAVVTCDGFRITASTTAESQVSYTRKAYRNVRVNPLKPKE